MQYHSEAAASAVQIFGGYLAVRRCEYLFDERQPKPVALVFVGAVALIKLVENVLFRLVRDARAAVLDGEYNAFAPL